MELKVLKNKRTGQISINIPKAVSELYGINGESKVSLETKEKKKHEFILRVENK